MSKSSKKIVSLRTLDMFRFGFFGLAVMAMTFFMTSVFTNEIPALANETYFVNTADDIDDGSCDQSHCSLREALNDANLRLNGEGIDRIYFEIRGEAPHTINLTKALPTITDPVIIDATTNDGYQDHPVIELSGGDIQLDGFVITAGESTVKGFVIRDFNGAGIYITGYGGNRIESNYLCTGFNGITSAPNHIGVNVEESSGNIIGGKSTSARNVIAGCGHASIVIDGASAKENLVCGNEIGLNKNLKPLPSPIGIMLNDATGNTVGGPSSAEQNRIYSNVDSLLMTGLASRGNSILENNFIE